MAFINVLLTYVHRAMQMRRAVKKQFGSNVACHLCVQLWSASWRFRQQL